jgi:hypothetical protein
MPNIIIQFVSKCAVTKASDKNINLQILSDKNH